MSKNPRAVFYFVFFTALFFYFYTESLLRESAVSNTNSEEFKLSQLIDALPSSIKDDVRYKMERAAIQDRINGAKTDAEKIDAITMMAMYTKDKLEKEKLFADIVGNYPQLPNSSTAYTFYFLRPKSDLSISMEKYHDFIQKCPPMEKPRIWNMGYQKLNKTKQKNEVKVQYLLPLLDYKPEYKNYFRLYDTLAKLAFKLKQGEVADKAKELKKACLSLPTVEAILRNKNMHRKKKVVKKNQKKNQKKTPKKTQSKKAKPAKAHLKGSTQSKTQSVKKGEEKPK